MIPLGSDEFNVGNPCSRHLDLVVLHGSRSRNDHSRYSDWDVGVWGKSKKDKGNFKIFETERKYQKEMEELNQKAYPESCQNIHVHWIWEPTKDRASELRMAMLLRDGKMLFATATGKKQWERWREEYTKYLKMSENNLLRLQVQGKLAQMKDACYKAISDGFKTADQIGVYSYFLNRIWLQTYLYPRSLIKFLVRLYRVRKPSNTKYYAPLLHSIPGAPKIADLNELVNDLLEIEMAGPDSITMHTGLDEKGENELNLKIGMRRLAAMARLCDSVEAALAGSWHEKGRR